MKNCFICLNRLQKFYNKGQSFKLKFAKDSTNPSRQLKKVSALEAPVLDIKNSQAPKNSLNQEFIKLVINSVLLSHSYSIHHKLKAPGKNLIPEKQLSK